MVEQQPERRRGMDEVQHELSALRRAVEGFAIAAENLVPKEDFDKSRKDLFRAGAAVALVIVVLGFMNLLSLQGTDRVLQRLEDCTTPTGQCYQQLRGEGADGQSQAVTSINSRLDTLRCLLFILPENRSGETLAPCLNGGE